MTEPSQRSARRACGWCFRSAGDTEKFAGDRLSRAGFRRRFDGRFRLRSECAEKTRTSATATVREPLGPVYSASKTRAGAAMTPRSAPKTRARRPLLARRPATCSVGAGYPHSRASSYRTSAGYRRRFAGVDERSRGNAAALRVFGSKEHGPRSARRMRTTMASTSTSAARKTRPSTPSVPASRLSAASEATPSEATRGAKRATPPVPLRFPFDLSAWPETDYVAPIAFLRSALFGIVPKGRRRSVEGLSLAHYGGFELRFTGEVLDQFDHDLWLVAVRLAREHGMGMNVHFSKRSILNALGWDTRRQINDAPA